jgi:hypothetical protein
MVSRVKSSICSSSSVASQPVAAGELRGDLAVAQAQGAHFLAQGAFLGRQGDPGASTSRASSARTRTRA